MYWIYPLQPPFLFQISRAPHALQFLMDLPSQSEFLYTRLWRADVDKVILDTALDHLGEATPLPDAALDDDMLRVLFRSLRNVFLYAFGSQEIKDRFQFLRDRFIAFKTMVETPGVYWCEEAKLIFADNITVRDVVQVLAFSGLSIVLIYTVFKLTPLSYVLPYLILFERGSLQRNRLSGAYRDYVEPEIAKLRRLFETDELKLRPFRVLFPRDRGRAGCSTNPVLIRDDESD